MDLRSNSAMARIVHCGVHLSATEGRGVAETYFQQWQVPPHIVLRVLSCAAFRRKPVAELVVSAGP